MKNSKFKFIVIKFCLIFALVYFRNELGYSPLLLVKHEAFGGDFVFLFLNVLGVLKLLNYFLVCDFVKIARV